MAGRYRFVFSGMSIFNTRSGHEDTDYASMSLIVGTNNLGQKTKFLGDLNNGNYGVSNGQDDGPHFEVEISVPYKKG